MTRTPPHVLVATPESLYILPQKAPHCLSVPKCDYRRVLRGAAPAATRIEA